MKLTVAVTIEGYSSYVSDTDMEDHLREIANQAIRYTEDLKYDDYNRKVQIDYDTQEALEGFNIIAKVTGVQE